MSNAAPYPVLTAEILIKVTSIRQPQSSCPFRSARQKIYGLGYGLLVFVYEKVDDRRTRTGRLDIKHTLFVEREHTADYQTTSAIRRILENQGNKDDLVALFEDRMLPADEIERSRLADEVLQTPPQVGYLTISNALQWRLQYSRIIEQAGAIAGIERLA